MEILKKIKAYIYENRHFIIASVLSAAAIITIIIIVSLIKNSNQKQIASDSELDSLHNTTSSSGELHDTTTNEQNSETTSFVSDKDFTLPEDSTEETETTLENSAYTYLIKVNRLQNCVTIYTKDSNGNFTVPYKAMACSTGLYINNTPLGTFGISSRYTWRLMVDGTHSQYATRFNGGILFHSVPCYRAAKDQLETAEFNKLGSPASLGCVRLTVADAKWIHDNCPYGTKVIVYDDDTPGPLGKPSVIKIPENNPYAGWDPTDPDSANPWNNCAPSIIASDITIKAGTSVNLLSTMSAADTCGNDITSGITITGSYNPNVVGTYEITLSVTDLLGRSATKSIVVKVIANSSAGNSSANKPNNNSTGNGSGSSSNASTGSTSGSTQTPSDTSATIEASDNNPSAGTTSPEESSNTEGGAESTTSPIE